MLHTWPLAANPGGLSRNDNADTMLNEWIVAWVAHQAPRAPLHLFDANIFHPERLTLAYSEHMAVQGLMAAPLSWMGASPVLAYNLVMLAGFALSALALWFVVWRWTGSSVAGFVAGSLLAFNAHTLTRLPHLQALHTEFLPIALFAFDRLLTHRRLRDAFLLGIAAALQALTSNYLLVFTAMALGLAAVVRADEWLRPFTRRTAGLLGLAAALGAALVVPFLVPYYLVQQEQGLTRTLDDVARYSSTWRDYLSTAGRLHYAAWSYRFAEGTTALFPGAVATALACYGLIAAPGWRDRRIRMMAVIGLAGVAMSFGPALPGYGLLYHVLPILQGLRGAARFGFLGLVAVAVLAGFGIAALGARLGSRRWWPAFAAVIVIAVHVGALRAPLVYRPFPGIPRIYQTLAAPDVTAVAEFPFYTPATVLRNAPYVLNSTAYWKPLVNGYSGFVPPGYVGIADALRGFPDDRSRDELRTLGVSHAVIHLDAYGSSAEAMAAVLHDTPWLELVAVDGPVRIYKLVTS
ncbi:MAG: hypothetical protein NTY02_17830 [Acidobacteria bacterium]|nr:hypothetical protein [Acidobacteriota bacterium]